MKLGYRFKDPALFELALTHRSVGKPNNERLEFLGDALLGALVAEMLYAAHPKASEGELSRLRAQLVNGQALALLARELDMGNSLKLGPGELKSGGFRRDSILADAFEALLAAIYLDGGMDACRESVQGWFGEQVASIRRSSKDAKTSLQEWLQAGSWPLPQYELTATHGEDHAKLFEVVCSVVEPQPLNATAQAGSRRAAEQEAAESVLDRLQRKKDA